MSKLGSVLGQEIVRLSKKAARGENQATRKASAQHRKDIAALKREVAALRRLVTGLQRQSPARKVAAVEQGTKPTRFVAKGFKTLRARLGVSAGEMGELLGVSAQTVYNWEAGTTRPGAKHLAALNAVRKMGKREVRGQLSQMLEMAPAASAPSKAARKRRTSKQASAGKQGAKRATAKKAEPLTSMMHVPPDQSRRKWSQSAKRAGKAAAKRKTVGRTASTAASKLGRNARRGAPRAKGKRIAKDAAAS